MRDLPVGLPPIFKKNLGMIRELAALPPGGILSRHTPPGQLPETVRQRWYYIMRLLRTDPRLASHPERRLAFDIEISLQYPKGKPAVIAFTRRHYPRAGGEDYYAEADLPQPTLTVGDLIHRAVKARLATDESTEAGFSIKIMCPHLDEDALEVTDIEHLGDEYDEYCRTTSTVQSWNVIFGDRIEGGYSLMMGTAMM